MAAQIKGYSSSGKVCACVRVCGERAAEAARLIHSRTTCTTVWTSASRFPLQERQRFFGEMWKKNIPELKQT